MNELILTGDHYFHAMLEDINHAHHSINLETYIFSGDKLGQRLSDALIVAVKRGVKVKVLIDGAGTSVWGNNITQMEAAGVLVRIFHPFPWKLWQWTRSNLQSSIFTRALYLLAKLNSRNHRKSCVIDGTIVYVGSANIDQSHMGLHEGGDNWRDTGVKLSHVDTRQLEHAFDIAWNGLTLEQRIEENLQRVEQDPIFRLNYLRHQRRRLY